MQEPEKKQICALETDALTSLRSLREESVSVVYLMPVPFRKNDNGKFIGQR